MLIYKRKAHGNKNRTLFKGKTALILKDYYHNKHNNYIEY